LGAFEAQTAEDRHWWFYTRYREIAACLASAGPLPQGLVLDVGCGAGNMCHHLSRYGQVLGVDVATKALAVAWRRGIPALPADAAALPFREGTFDLVALFDVLEHCRDDLAVLLEARRVLKPGGLVAITVPAFRWLWSYNDVVNNHFRRYSRLELVRTLSSAGLETARVSYTHGFAFVPMLLLALWRRATGRQPRIATPEAEEDAYQVEMEGVPEPLNRLLRLLGEGEARLLRHIGLPAGTGLVAVERKPC